MKRTRDDLALWQRHLDQWRTSGLTQGAYCRQRDLNFTTFARYRNRINRERKVGVVADVAFIPVTVPVRQQVLSFPIPLRFLFAAHPQLLTPVLQIIHRVITRFLLKQAGLKGDEAHTGAVTLIQRFGSAANLNIHLHCLVLDGFYRSSEGTPVFHEARAPTGDELQALLAKIIRQILKCLTRQGTLIEEEGMSYLADTEADHSRRCKRPRALTASPLGPTQGRRCSACKACLAEQRHPVKPCAPTRMASPEQGTRASCGCALRRRSAQGTRTPMPHHHPPGDCQ